VDRAFIQKLIWTVLAIGVYVLTVFVPDVSSDLKVIAGLVIGAVWINAKDNAKAAVMLLALCSLPLVNACATWADVKPVARDVNNIARELCEASMGAEAERQGLPIREFCAISFIIAPFLEAQHLAAANAKLGRELTVHECVP
jgi:cytochrome b